MRKRSEMLEEIVSTIDQWEPGVRSACFIGTIEDLAESILHKIEDSGMLPPDRGYFDDHQGYLPNFSWVEEDKLYKCGNCGTDSTLIAENSFYHDCTKCGKDPGYKDDFRGYKIEGDWIVKK